jgi:hypothetical protein
MRFQYFKQNWTYNWYLYFMGPLHPPGECIDFKQIHAKIQRDREGQQHKFEFEFSCCLVLRFWYYKHKPTCWLKHWIVVRHSSTLYLALGQKNWSMQLLHVSICGQVWRQTVLNSHLRAWKSRNGFASHTAKKFTTSCERSIHQLAPVVIQQSLSWIEVAHEFCNDIQHFFIGLFSLSEILNHNKHTQQEFPEAL